LKGVKITAGDYNQGQLGERVGKEPLVADIVSTWQRLGNNEPTLCYAVDRAHARAIHDKFESAGIGVGYCDAFTEIPERQELFRKMKSGEIRIICNVGTLTTGIDEDIRCIILARPTRSEMLFVQIIGRGLRTTPGKQTCIILDHSDTTKRLGFVDEIDYDELDDGKPKKKNSQAVKKEKLPKACPSCQFLKPAGVWACPQCGFKPQKQSQVEHVDGELKELKRAKIDHYQTYQELLWYARKHGKKDGWAWHKTRERCGRAPKSVHHLEPIPVTGDTLNWIVSQNIRYAKRRRA
jgi:superfamily II DNA or RNA helicase